MKEFTSKPSKPVPFKLDGVVFEATGGVSMLEFAELLRLKNVDTLSPQAMEAVGSFFVNILGAGYPSFREHCAEHNTDDDTLFDVVAYIMEQRAAGFPTQPPADSSNGSSNTPLTYRVVSSSGVREEALTPQREAELRAAIARVESHG